MKYYNVHRFTLSAIRGELLQREREKERQFWDITGYLLSIVKSKRERERDRERERQRQTERDREIERETERKTERVRETER